MGAGRRLYHEWVDTPAFRRVRWYAAPDNRRIDVRLIFTDQYGQAKVPYRNPSAAQLDWASFIGGKLDTRTLRRRAG